MSDEVDITAQELAEALVCIAKLIVFFRKVGWEDDAGILVELEDDLSEYHQEAR